MKTFSFFMLMASTLFLLNCSSVLGQQLQCPPEDNCTAWITVQDVVPAPGFPNCSVLVNYDLRNCQGEAQIQINFWGPLASDATDCAPFIQTFINDFSQLEPIFKDIERAVADLFFLNTYNGVGSPANAAFECPQTVETFVVSFYRPNCNSYCLGYNPAIQGYEVSSSPCNPDGCCAMSRSYCYNTTTNEIESVETTELVNGTFNCGETTFPECRFEEGYSLVGQSPCNVSCR